MYIYIHAGAIRGSQLHIVIWKSNLLKYGIYAYIYTCTYIHIQAYSQFEEASDQLDIVDMETQSIKTWHICIYTYTYINIQAYSQSEEACEQLDIVDMETQSISV